MSNARLYPFWGSLAEALRTGEPQNETTRGEDFFAALYRDPGRLRQFLAGMTGLSMGAAMALTDGFDWARYRTVVDIGTAQGCVPVQLAGATRTSQAAGSTFHQWVPCSTNTSPATDSPTA